MIRKVLNKLSLQLRLSLLFGVLMTGFALVLMFFMFSLSSTVFKTEAQQHLIRTVERDLDEAEYERGIFKQEEDFVYHSNDAHILLYDRSGTVIAGDLPSGFKSKPEFIDGLLQTVTEEEESFFVYDTLIQFNKYEYTINAINGDIISYGTDSISSFVQYNGTMGAVKPEYITIQKAFEIAAKNERIPLSEATLLTASLDNNISDIYTIEFYSEITNYDEVWIRGIVPTENKDGISSLLKVALIILPLLIIIFLIIGYFVTKKTLMPLKIVRNTANRLGKCEDLSQRINIKEGPLEITQLSNAFDNMAQNLQDAFERERRFTSDVSHELRTPVTVILAACGEAMDDYATKEDINEALEVINRQTLKMRSMITQLLEFTRMEQGRMRLSLEEANLSQIVEAICEDSYSGDNEKNIKVSYTAQPDIIMNLDVELMTRLIDNLVSNAIKYGKENGFVKIALKKAEDKIILSVEDNGIGISKDDIDGIFQSFYRGENAIAQSGHGLGLSLAKRIAMLHGGNITVESELSKGSKFTVIFKEI